MVDSVSGEGLTSWFIDGSGVPVCSSDLGARELSGVSLSLFFFFFGLLMVYRVPGPGISSEPQSKSMPQLWKRRIF